MRDQLGHLEDQIRGRGALHHFAVQRQRELDRVVSSGLVGGHKRGTARCRAVESLARDPLRRRKLKVASGEVVQQRVARDAGEGFICLDLLEAAPDHDAHFGLVVHLLACLR